RVVDRRLRGVAQRRVRAAAEHVIDPEHVGEEQSVKTPALQHLRKMGPVGQAVILRGAVARMRPQSRRLMRHAIHGEGVEPDLLGHCEYPGKDSRAAQPRDDCVIAPPTPSYAGSTRVSIALQKDSFEDDGWP